MKIDCLSSFLLGWMLCAAGVPTLLASPEDSSFDRSEWWPPFVELTHELDGGEDTLRAGKRGVLLRLEDPGTALVDFGRSGVLQVDVFHTDLSERYAEFASGRRTKQYGNLVEMLGPRMLQGSAEGLRRVEMTGQGSEAGRFEYFLFLYVGNDEAAFAALSSQYAEWTESLKERNVATLVMPLFFVSNESLWRRLQEGSLKSCYMLYDFVAEGYVQSLRHDASGPSTVVLCDKDGKLLYRSSTPAWDDILAVIVGQKHASSSDNLMTTQN